MMPTKSCARCNKNYWWRDIHGKQRCRSCHPPAGEEKKPEWIHSSVWEHYTGMKPDNPEKIFLKTIIADVGMEKAWKSLSKHIERKFPYEIERLLRFAAVAFGLYLGIPAEERLTKKEACDARDEAAKKSRELARELDRLGYWHWGPAEVGVIDELSVHERAAWDDIHAINQMLTMKRLLNRLADRLNAENQRPRVLSRPNDDNAKKHHMARELAAYLKSDLQMKRGYRGIISATIRTVLQCDCSDDNVKEWLKS